MNYYFVRVSDYNLLEYLKQNKKERKKDEPVITMPEDPNGSLKM